MTTFPTDAAATAVRPRRTPATILLTMGVIAFVLLAALGAVAVVLSSRANASADEDQTVLEIARQDAVDFTTYHSNNLAADFKRFDARATGSARKDYRLATSALVSEFKSSQVNAVGSVIRSALINRTAASATVLIALDDEVRNKGVPQGQEVYDRLAFVLTKVNGTWLVSEVHEI